MSVYYEMFKCFECSSFVTVRPKKFVLPSFLVCATVCSGKGDVSVAFVDVGKTFFTLSRVASV